MQRCSRDAGPLSEIFSGFENQWDEAGCIGSHMYHIKGNWSQQLSKSCSWKNLSKAHEQSEASDLEQEIAEKSKRPVGRARATGVEGKDRQEKGRVSLLQPLRCQAAHPGSSKQQGKTEGRDPGPQKQHKVGIWS